VNGNNSKKKRRKLIIWGSVVAVIVLLIAVGVIVAKSGGTKIDPTKLAKVEKGDLAKSVVATGKVTPITKVEVKSKASGIVKKLYVDYGDRVKQGQLLAQLDKVEIQAQVDQSRAALEAAQLNLSYCHIVAPVGGVATHKSVEPGQIVQPGQGLLVVVPLNDIWVTANFKETQLKNMRAGQRAEVNVDTYGKTFPGHVDSISGATGAVLSLLPPENATGNYVKVVQRIPVKIVLDPISPSVAILRPGMNVDATVITK